MIRSAEMTPKPMCLWRHRATCTVPVCSLNVCCLCCQDDSCCFWLLHSCSGWVWLSGLSSLRPATGLGSNQSKHKHTSSQQKNSFCHVWSAWGVVCLLVSEVQDIKTIPHILCYIFFNINIAKRFFYGCKPFIVSVNIYVAQKLL